MNLLKSTQVIPASLPDVFAFFDKPENLAAITPPWLGFRILTPLPVLMAKGTVIDYAISIGPVPTRWRSLITTYNPPHFFVDEQMLGPYSFWHHSHRFRAVAEGTLIEDEVRYLMPFGLLGEVAHRMMVRRQLEGIFNHRQSFMAKKFGVEVDQPAHLEFSSI
jgi:ligand-binding SRPBCC domain-containing protein